MRRYLSGLLALALWPTAALAGPPPGVTYDPGSPAGKEYALPLDTARARANPIRPGSGSPAVVAGVGNGVAATPPLFGAGIQPVHQSAKRGGSPSKPRVGSGKVSGGSPQPGRARRHVATLGPRISGSASSKLAIGTGFAAGVALFGLGAGLGARRLRRR